MLLCTQSDRRFDIHNKDVHVDDSNGRYYICKSTCINACQDTRGV